MKWEINVSGKDKSTRIMSLYHQLLSGIKVRKQTFCLENGINERSFDRDIEDVRLFLSDMQPYCELIYDRSEKIYYFTHTVGDTLSGEETLFLSNVLLTQKNVRKDELIGMLENLINNTEASRRNEICKFLEMKLKFTKKVTNVAILKMHWDMGRAIYNCCQIELEYKLEEHNYVMRKVNPVELHFEGGHIYLIAYIVDKTYNSPAFYRLDRIRSFKIINSKYPADVKEEYLNKDIHSNRYSMLAGEEISVTVRVECSMKKVIDDLFPEYKEVDSNKDETVFEIRTYKQGFISWLLGQGNKVEVIEPVALRLELLIKIQELQKIYSEKGVE